MTPQPADLGAAPETETVNGMAVMVFTALFVTLLVAADLFLSRRTLPLV